MGLYNDDDIVFVSVAIAVVSVFDNAVAITSAINAYFPAVGNFYA